MTLIDHMLTNSTEKINKHGVIHVGMSDHSLSYLIWKSKNENSSRLINYRKLSGINIESYLEDLGNQPWHEILDCTCVSEAVKKWESFLMNVVNLHMPIRSKKIRIRSPHG